MPEPKLFFDQHPEIETIEAFLVDVNGVLRGKKIPRETSGKIFKGGLRMPYSIFAVDVWGQDVLPAGLVAETGDSDGVCQAVPGSLHRVPWSERPSAQVLLSMSDAKGRPFFADPRQVLRKVVDLYAKKGLTPVVAAELEFYLLDNKPDERGNPQPPLLPRTGRRAWGSHLLSVSELDEFGAVLTGINDACREQGIPADTAISENGPGQYEINLNHVPDALLAADQAVLMKRIVRGIARRNGMDATFMAKPYGDRSGSGMHVHFSVIDRNGRNIFEGRDVKGSPALRHAIGGLLQAMPDSTAIFAPNLNSYRRFAAGSHAPTTVSWGYDNRLAALRIPESDLAATRIEHRVPGADANPYLMLAAMLAAAYHGIANKIDPGKPFAGDVYASGAKRLPSTWGGAMEAFENSKFIVKYIGRDYRKLYLACKRQEKEELERRVSSLEYDAYLRDI
jgi:glutamine synthetase